jgi:uncharacterized protein (DUF3084 family)
VINPVSPAPPPTLPSDAALMGAMALLQSLGNAQNTAATLSQLADHKLAIDKATADFNAAAKTATDAQAALGNVQAQVEDLAAREKALADAQLQLRVASAAVQDRDHALDIRSNELDQREQQVAAAEKAHAAKLASMRAALG